MGFLRISAVGTNIVGSNAVGGSDILSNSVAFNVGLHR